MKKVCIVSKLTGLTLILISLVMAYPKNSYADWGRGYRNHGFDHNRYDHRYFGNNFDHRFYHRYPHNGISFSLNNGFMSIAVRGSNYYYDDGIYYRKNLNTYYVVEPPVGAVVRYLPSYYSPVNVRGTTYYVYDGIYYRPMSSGYIVTDSPVSNVESQTQIQNSISDTSLTVNVPNQKGGFTPVVLKKSGEGYVGPQGEYYPDFPKVDQLRIMYGNN